LVNVRLDLMVERTDDLTGSPCRAVICKYRRLRRGIFGGWDVVYHDVEQQWTNDATLRCSVLHRERVRHCVSDLDLNRPAGQEVFDVVVYLAAYSKLAQLVH